MLSVQNNGANGCIDCQGGNNGKITQPGEVAQPCGSCSLPSASTSRIEAGTALQGGSHRLPPYFLAFYVDALVSSDREKTFLESRLIKTLGRLLEDSFGEPRQPYCGTCMGKLHFPLGTISVPSFTPDRTRALKPVEAGRSS